MTAPSGIHLVIPSTLAVNEPFAARLRVLGDPHAVDCRGAYCTRKPGLGSPFNLNVERRIQFMDDCLPEWQGVLQVHRCGSLRGPAELVFDGREQGAFAGDRRLVWGDPHWQTFFSDGIRCPEELYHFAWHEAFLDFGAISDHMEALTPRQWDYFVAVTNDYNRAGEFVALIGEEWTHHHPQHGAPGHRNVYFRGDRGPLLSSMDEDCNSLDKLWATLDAFGRPALAIPHHSANVVMGVDWEQGWNPVYEKAVEIVSVWGSSEKPESAGDTRPIRALKGEMEGRHVVDALRRGYRFGFVGGGDIHDGRPGLALHAESYPKMDHVPYAQGLTAAWLPELTREHVFDAIRDHQTYATTSSRIYLQVADQDDGLEIRAASEDGLQRLVLVTGAGEKHLEALERGARCAELRVDLATLDERDFRYVRVETTRGEMAWSSPRYGADL